MTAPNVKSFDSQLVDRHGKNTAARCNFITDITNLHDQPHTASDMMDQTQDDLART